jgi:hypothetical protein
MRRRLLVRMILLAAFVGGLCLELQRLSAAQVHTNVALDSSSTADEKNAVENEQAPPHSIQTGRDDRSNHQART